MTEKEKILLVLRAQTGDRPALNKLLESIQDSLYWYIYNTLSSKTYAKDILQEVFILIYKKLPGLNYPEYFNSWAYRIASREIFRFIKRNKKLFEQVTDNEELDKIVSPENYKDNNEPITEKLFALINVLPPATSAVISLHYRNQMPINEIADVLDIPVGTVKSRLSYGLKLLRNKIDKSITLKETVNGLQ